MEWDIKLRVRGSSPQDFALAIQNLTQELGKLGGAVETVTDNDETPHHVQGHGRGGYSTAERLAALLEALKAYSLKHPSVGGISGDTGDFVRALAPYGYPDSGCSWWGKDHKAVSQTDTERIYTYHGDERPCQYGITWAAERPQHILSGGSPLEKKKKTNKKELV